MADVVKDLFKQALKYTQDGKLDKAIEAYKSILQKTPKDARVLNNLGDLYLRKHNDREAAGIFSSLAQLYEEDGYTLRAIAICQKVLKIDPERLDMKARMAGLYARQGLVAEARAQYLDLADGYDQQGKVKEALEIFRKLADLDPGNLPVRVKLGNMFHKEGMKAKAAGEWVRAAEGYLRASRQAQAIELLEKAVEADPEAVQPRVMLAGEELRREGNERAVELLFPLVEGGKGEVEVLKMYAAALLRCQRHAEAAVVLKAALDKEPGSLPIRENLGLALLRSGDRASAAEHLHKVVAACLKDNLADRAEKVALELRQADPEDAATLQKLVEIYTHGGRREKLVGVYRELTDLYERRGLRKNVLGVLEKLVEADPGEPSWKARAEELRRELRSAGSAAPPAGEKVKPPREELEADRGAALAAEDEIAEEELVIEAEEEPAPVVTPLAHAEGLLRRGMFAEAEAELRRMTAAEPSLEVLQTLKELYRLQGKPTAYAEACFDVATFLQERGNLAEAVREYQDILAADPGNTLAKESLADLVVALGPGEPPEPEEAVAPPAPFDEPLVEIPDVDLEDMAELDLEHFAEEISSAPREARPAPTPRAAHPAPPPQAPAPPGETDEMVAEADFYYQQGLLEEAERLYRAVLARDPGRGEVADRLAELAGATAGGTASFSIGDQDLADFDRSFDDGIPAKGGEMKFTVAGGAAVAPPAGAGDFSDFLTSLKEEVEAPVVPPAALSEEESLQEIFQEFKEGVRRNLSEEDYETHYNLGIAYKEMGLIDEAVAEFDLASRSPDFYVDAASMTALCYKDSGDVDRAVEVIRGALDRLGPGHEGRKGLLWELASLFEERGEKQRAVDLYLSVYGMDEAYRGIREKLRSLGALEPGGSAPEAAPLEEAAAPEEEPPGQRGPSSRGKSRVSYL